MQNTNLQLGLSCLISIKNQDHLGVLRLQKSVKRLYKTFQNPPTTTSPKQ